MKKSIYLFFVIALFVDSVFGQDNPIRIYFSNTTAEANGVSLQGPGFGAYPQAQTVFGQIPTDNLFTDATDGMGAAITAAPGQGVMIIGETVHTPNAAMIRCTARADASYAAITLAAVDAGKNQFVSTNSPNNGEYFMGAYKRISAFFVPPSTGFRPLIQVMNTSDSQTLTVYIDNLDVYLLDSEKYYHAQFLDGDEKDPTIISQSAFGGSQGGSTGETAAIDVQPACAVMDIDQKIGFSSNYAVEGYGRLHWWTGNIDILSIASNGAAKGLNAGNGRVNVQMGADSGNALVFVNPISAVHCDRDYEWYRTQMGTGEASYNNCGPTSTQMAIHWFSGTNATVSTIRALSPRDNGWWYTTDITEALEKYGVPYAIHSAYQKSDILNCLKRGNIVLLCAEMKWIEYSSDPFYGRFYTFNSGHFFLVKGHSTDGDYFVAYDPNSWESDYDESGVMLGRNRFYLSSEVLRSIRDWWPYCIEIGAPASKSTVRLASVPVASAGPNGSQREQNNQ